MSALDDKDVPSAEQWRAAVQFMTTSLRKQTEEAGTALSSLEGPTSYYDRYFRWQSQTEQQAKRKAIADELSKFLAAEPASSCVCECVGAVSCVYVHLCRVTPASCTQMRLLQSSGS